jgi:hypothetical protein
VIIQLHTQDDDVLLMIDANESVNDAKQLTQFLSQTNLTSLIQPVHKMGATYNRGSKCIDYIFGSHRLLAGVIQAGYLPFYEGAWPQSDHRGLFIDLDHIHVFGAATNSIIPPPRRQLTSENRSRIKKFLKTLSDSGKIPQLLERITAVAAITSCDHSDHKELEEIDTAFTTVLLQAEQSAAVPSTPWSPKLHQAFLIHSYWSIHRSAYLNKRDATQQLLAIEAKLPQDAVYQGQRNRSNIGQKRLARKTLANIQIAPRSHRNSFLHTQQEVQIDDGKLTRAKAIQTLRHQENRQQGWNIVKQLAKNKSAGGISYLLVPIVDDAGKEVGRARILDKRQMDQSLYHRNRDHFAQAAGTPFNQPPALSALQFSGCTETAEAILNGDTPQHFDQYMQALLSQLRRVQAPISMEIDFQEMCNSFDHWRERTATSPSNKHLGIYKSLVSAVNLGLHTMTINLVQHP